MVALPGLVLASGSSGKMGRGGGSGNGAVGVIGVGVYVGEHLEGVGYGVFAVSCVLKCLVSQVVLLTFWEENMA